jgi:hypothetical protein
MAEPEAVPLLDDPLVRRMAERDHVPRELRTYGGGPAILCCEACSGTWPCATRRALRALVAQTCTCPRVEVGYPGRDETMPGGEMVPGWSADCPVHGREAARG